MFFAFKILLTGCVVAFTSWLSAKRPDLAGFLISLPIMTMMALPFSYAEYQDADTAITFAKSIMLAVPLSLTFFIPFLMAKPIMAFMPDGFGFWALYGLGVICLVGAYFAHQFLLKAIT